jgi:hypothetical protein
VSRLIAVGALALALIACGNDPEPLTDREWCEREVWDEGRGPDGWSRDEVIDDCTAALESTFTREMVLDAYEGMQEEGG